MGEQGSDTTVRVFSARACAAPLEEAAALFEQVAQASSLSPHRQDACATGSIRVAISACSRHCAQPVAEEAVGADGSHDFLDEIAEAGVHDLAIGGAEFLLDDGEVRGIIAKGERRTIACRRSAIIVPAGNPKNVRTVHDLARRGVRVGVSVLDCLKGLWEDVAARLGLLEAIRRNIAFHANGCIAIVEAVAGGKVDAAVGWSAFAHLAPGRIEIVELPPAQQVFRGTGVGLLTFARQPELARRFMDFLTTPAARACYARYGWVAPDQGAGNEHARGSA